MTAEQMAKASDDELRQVITLAEAELQERAEKRRKEAIEEIRRIAASEHIPISIGSQERKRAAKHLQAGMRFFNADRPDQVYEVGKGRPPAWFAKGRGKPMPEDAKSHL